MEWRGAEVDSFHQTFSSCFLEEVWRQLQTQDALPIDWYALGLACWSEQSLSESLLQMEDPKDRQVHSTAYWRWVLRYQRPAEIGPAWLGIPVSGQHQYVVLDVSQSGQHVQNWRFLRHSRQRMAAHHNSDISSLKVRDSSSLLRLHNTYFWLKTRFDQRRFIYKYRQLSSLSLPVCFQKTLLPIRRLPIYLILSRAIDRYPLNWGDFG